MNIKRNIFITGGNGFVGNRIINELKQDYNLYILTRKNKLDSSVGVHYISGDLLTLAIKDEFFNKIDFVIHAAGEKKDEHKMFEVNVLGSKKIAELVNFHQHLKLIHISSGGVFGIYNHHEKIITETSQCLPNNTYEHTKLQAEKEIELIEGEKRYIILRPTNIFGENDPTSKLLTLIKTVKFNKFFFLKKTAKVNYLYLGQLTHIIKTIIDRNLIDNEIYIVNSNCTIEKFIQLIQQKLNVTFTIKKMPELIVKPLFLLARISDFLPIRYQKLTTSKVYEMSSENYYSTDKINQLLEENTEMDYLKIGISKLIDDYKERKLI